MKFKLQQSFLLFVVATTTCIFAPTYVLGQDEDSDCNICGEGFVITDESDEVKLCDYITCPDGVSNPDCADLQDEIDDGTFDALGDAGCPIVQDIVESEDSCGCQPRAEPTESPTESPVTPSPTPQPVTPSPTPQPATPEPTPVPTPLRATTQNPTQNPTPEPTEAPSPEPTDSPSIAPTDSLFTQVQELTDRILALEGEMSVFREALSIALFDRETLNGEAP